MKIIKLDAIDSTNSFLKDLARGIDLENFTTVVAKEQTSGRGQRGKYWQSKEGKNLLFSTIVYHQNLIIRYQTFLNYTVSLVIFDVLKELKIPKLAIKWPNDIMADNKKICGILIENSIKKDKIYSSVIGIGLNVNQQKFNSDVPNASSLKNILNQEMDLNFILEKIILKLKFYISLLHQQKYMLLKEKYLAVLYKKNILSVFKNNQNTYFRGMIKGVSFEGKLQIQLEDNSMKEFAIKEVAFS